MYPQSNENSNVNLPQPNVESAHAPSTETAGAGFPALAPAPIPTMAAPLIPTLPTGVPYPLQPQATSTLDASPSDSTQPTDDGDLIEKEWVDKAKQIVQRNLDDPYKQSREMTIFRADYMQKRYNKTIKLGD